LQFFFNFKYLGGFLKKLISNDFNFIMQPLVIGIFYMIECSLLVFFEDTGFETLSFIPILLTIVYSVFFG